MPGYLKWLLVCGALAFGESVAFAARELSPTWPAVGIAMVLVVLFGYGFAIRGWIYIAVTMLGLMLAFVAIQDRQDRYRDRFWLRDRDERIRQTEMQRTYAPFIAVRKELSRRIGIGLEHSPEIADLNRAILLGEKRRLPKELKQTFVDSGSLHVFAISGLHVMAIAKVMIVILMVFGLPRRFIGLLAIPLLWVYVLTIGMPPSAVRAAIMATFYLSAYLFWRRPDGIMSWALTFLLVHLTSPGNIADVGSLFSFSVMLGIVLWCRYSQRFGSQLITGFGVTLVAWAIGVPIVAHVFGRITPGGLIANIVLIPAASITVMSGVIGILASYVWEALAAHLNNLAALFVELMVGISYAISSIPGASFEVTHWPMWECIAWYVAILLGWYLYHSISTRRLLD